MTLRPGDIIFTGTPKGCFRQAEGSADLAQVGDSW